MEKGYFSADELHEQNVGMIHEKCECAKDLARLRVRPPGTPQRVAGNDSDNRYDLLVLLEKQSRGLKVSEYIGKKCHP